MVLAVLLAACGGSDDGDETGQESASSGDDSGSSADADEYIGPLAASIPEGDEGLPVNEEQATCMATALVNVVGVDALKDAGVSPAEFVETDDFASLGVELPPDATAQLGADLGQCDITEELEGLLISPFADEFGAELPPEGAACLAENMDDQAVADGFAEALLEGTDTSFQATLGSAIGACPTVASTVFISQAPVELSPEAQACVSGFITANPEMVAAVFTSGGEDQTAVQQLGSQLGTACPEYAGQ
jgi:hypothetical protein